MRKKGLLLVAACGLLVLTGSIVHADENEFFWKEFKNLAGEACYYPVPKTEPDITEDVLSGQSGDDQAPEIAEIGDVFQGREGYERVIAISEDGAFVTELITEEEASQ